MVKCNLLLTSLVIMLDLRNVFHIILGQCEIFMTWAKFYHHICILYNCPSLLWLETNGPFNRCNLIHFSGILTAHAGVAAMPQSVAALSAPSAASKTAKVAPPIRAQTSLPGCPLHSSACSHTLLMLKTNALSFLLSRLFAA